MSDTVAAVKNNINEIKDFFGDKRPVSMTELKDLSKEERQELADLIRAL